MRWLGVAAVAGFVLAQGCSSTPKCDATSCSAGCCDPAGHCLAGTVSSQCGRGGIACVACSSTQTCEVGTCANIGSGGDAGSGDAGGSDAGSTADAGATDAGSLATIGHDLIDALCAYYARCGRVESAATCSQLNSPLIHEGSFLYDQKQAVKHGRAVFDQAGATACFDALRITGACTSPNDLCAQVLSGLFILGQVVDGNYCYTSTECGASSYCTSDTSGLCPGTCTPRLGTSVAVTRAVQCLRSLYDYNGACEAPVTNGGSCAPLDGGAIVQFCAQADFCDVPSDVCTPLLSAGDACAGQVSAACRVSTFCDNSNCQSWAVNGAVCGASAPSKVLCQEDLTCLPAVIDGGASQCRHVSSTNACLADFDCGFGSYCTGASSTAFGTCVSAGGVNAGCTAANQCASDLYCNGLNRCASLSDLWGPCEPTTAGCFNPWSCVADGGSYQCVPQLGCVDLAP